jgi:hypothetical protein
MVLRAMREPSKHLREAYLAAAQFFALDAEQEERRCVNSAS